MVSSTESRGELRLALVAVGTEIWRLAYWPGRKSAPSRGADVMLQLPFSLSSRSSSTFGGTPNFDLIVPCKPWDWLVGTRRTEGRASFSCLYIRGTYLGAYLSTSKRYICRSCRLRRVIKNKDEAETASTASCSPADGVVSRSARPELRRTASLHPRVIHRKAGLSTATVILFPLPPLSPSLALSLSLPPSPPLFACPYLLVRSTYDQIY